MPPLRCRRICRATTHRDRPATTPAVLAWVAAAQQHGQYRPPQDPRVSEGFGRRPPVITVYSASCYRRPGDRPQRAHRDPYPQTVQIGISTPFIGTMGNLCTTVTFTAVYQGIVAVSLSLVIRPVDSAAAVAGSNSQTQCSGHSTWQRGGTMVGGAGGTNGVVASGHIGEERVEA